MMKEKHPKLRKKRVSMELRRQMVLGMKLGGLSDRAIVERLKGQHGISVHHSTVNADWKAVLADMKKLNADEVPEYRAFMSRRYERLIGSFWIQALAGDAKAGEQVHKALKGLRELNGLDRELGTEENPHTYQSGDAEYDYSKFSDEELETIAALEEAARITRRPQS